MRCKTVFIKWLCAVLFFLPAAAVAQEVPSATGWVNDFANVLTPEDNQKISAVINELEKKTSAEIAVVTIQSIAPYDEKQYARMLFDKWRPGKKGKDNGVLVLLAVKERRWRIETGYGVEGVLPDGLCGSIGRDYMVPAFKEGNYGTGLYRGVVAIAQSIALDSHVTVESLQGIRLQKESQEVPLLLYFFSFFFFLVWNLPWPFVIGVPVTLLFALAFYAAAPVLGALVIAGYICSMLLRYFIWSKIPADKRGSFFGPLSYGGGAGGSNSSAGGWSSGGGGFGGGGFGGGGGGGGGSGGGF